MYSITEVDLLYFIFLCAAVHLTWGVAKRHGISQCIDYLEKEGLLELDED